MEELREDGADGGWAAPRRPLVAARPEAEARLRGAERLLAVVAVERLLARPPLPAARVRPEAAPRRGLALAERAAGRALGEAAAAAWGLAAGVAEPPDAGLVAAAGVAGGLAPAAAVPAPEGLAPLGPVPPGPAGLEAVVVTALGAEGGFMAPGVLEAAAAMGEVRVRRGVRLAMAGKERGLGEVSVRSR